VERLKIVHLTSVHSALDPRIFKKECRSLARAGFDVTVVAPYANDAVEEDVHIRPVKKYESRFARVTRTVLQVFREAKRLDADVYHFHDPELIPVGLLLRTSGKKVVYDIHEDLPKDILVKDYLPRWSRPLISWVADRVERAACRNLSALVSVTPSIAERLHSANHRIIILYNYPYANELADCGSWEKRRMAATYVGTVSPQRGIAEMVLAMGLLADSYGATLEIAGDCMPEEVKSLRGWERVHFYGALDQPTTYRLLQSVRIGVVCEHPVPSFLEAVPVKLFEYMGAALPVIASDFPLWREMLQGVDCAIFVDPLNAQEIADAMEYLLSHPRVAEEMGRRGQSAVMERFNWTTQFPKLVGLYSELAGQPCAV